MSKFPKARVSIFLLTALVLANSAFLLIARSQRPSGPVNPIPRPVEMRPPMREAIPRPTPLTMMQVDESAIEGKKAAVKVVVQGEPAREEVFLVDAAEAIETRVVEVPRDTPVSELLVERGIEADTYSKSVFMDLNPDIKNIEEPISKGKKVVLPMVYFSNVRLRYARQIHWYAIAVSPEKYSELEKQTKHLKLNTDAISGFSSNRFANADVQREFNQTLSESVRLLEELRSMPMNTATLNRVNHDSAILNSMSEISMQGKMITENELRTAKSASRSLNYRATLARAGINQRGLTVAVNLKGVQHLPTDLLRVYYCVEGDFRNAVAREKDPYAARPHMFPLTRNPSIGNLDPEVNYYFWVVREDNKQRLTNVDINSPITIAPQPQSCPPEIKADFCYDMPVSSPQ